MSEYINKIKVVDIASCPFVVSWFHRLLFFSRLYMVRNFIQDLASLTPSSPILRCHAGTSHCCSIASIGTVDLPL